MRQTLFHIPHDLFGLPVLGFGLILILWAVLSGALLVWLLRRQGWNSDTWGYVPVLLVLGGAIAFMLPMLEEKIPKNFLTNELVEQMVASGRATEDAKEVNFGLPIRGYGAMMMIATLLAVGLAVYRARRMGLHEEVFFSLAFWMFIAGIAGARVLFVALNWWSFSHDSNGQPLAIIEIAKSVFSVTNGGLVVYGSLLAALPAGLFFLKRRKLPALAIGDIIAPSMLLGLAIGRVGCLLNGCCYGGICQETDVLRAIALQFPRANPPVNIHDSPAYQHQRSLGRLHGIELGENQKRQVVIKRIDPQGPAADLGFKVGDVVEKVNGIEVQSLDSVVNHNLIYHAKISIKTEIRTEPVVWSIGKLPDLSRPVHPTQLYSAINALLMCFFLWVYYPFRRHDGEVFALLLMTYPVARILLEIIRNDEPGRFGTVLTISQWVSLFLLLSGVVLWVYVSMQPRGSALPFAQEQKETVTKEPLVQ